MNDLNYLAILVATVVAFVVTGAWYAGLGGQLARLSPAYADPRPSSFWWIPAEVLRSLVVAAVVAWLALQTGIDGWTDAVLLGLVLWVGFPFIILSGAVLHEKVPWQLAAIHIGDWFLKLIAITVIVGRWQ